MEPKISVSIDIGTRNFAFCVEEYDFDFLQSLPHIPENDRYLPNGTASPTFQEVLTSAAYAGTILEFRNEDLAKGQKNRGLDNDILHNMTELLDKYHDLWTVCDVILIEEQMHFRGKNNVKALKAAQHCATYFLVRYGRKINVIDYDANLKYKVNGAPKVRKITKAGKISYSSMDKPARKKWSPTEARKILTQRGDAHYLKLMTGAKADDLADCLLQALSYWILHAYGEI